jgi:hypothetical protein
MFSSHVSPSKVLRAATEEMPGEPGDTGVAAPSEAPAASGAERPTERAQAAGARLGGAG